MLDDRARFGVLPAGGSETRNITLRLPADQLASGYLIVRSDNRDQVYELNNDNNLLSTAINIDDDRPDLSVSSFEPRLGSRQIQPGATLAFDYAVSNRGLGPTYGRSWTDQVYLSSDATLGNNDDILLTSLTNARQLSPNDAYSRLSENLLIPASTPLGNYRMFLVTDARRVVPELDESNNVVTSVDFLITNTPSTGTQLADLDVVSLIVPATLTSGNDLPISWKVRNSTAFATSSAIWYDDVWLSQDASIDSSDIRIGRYLHNGVLQAGGEYSRSINWPVDLDLAGSYNVIVQTDSTNMIAEGSGEANNKRVSSPATVIALGPAPDLRVSAITLPTEPAYSGRQFSLGWTVQNAGDGTAKAPWADRAFLSLDQIYDPATDIPLGYTDRNVSLVGRTEYTATQNYTIPAGVGGAYYVIVITDSTNRVNERQLENNNVTVSAQPLQIAHLPPVDLVVGDITIPVDGTLGQSATIKATITNNSAFLAKGGWFDAFYLSSDDQWDINDGYFGRVLRTGDLPSGASYTAELTAPLPGVLPGNYKVIIRSDIRNNVVEGNELNNFKATLNSFRIDVPSLTLDKASEGSIARGGAVYYKVDVPAGETVAIEWDGAAATGAIELYASFGTMPRRSQADLVALEPYRPDQRIVISSTQGGTYYIMAFGQDVESGLSNYSIIARIVPFSVFDTSYGQGGTAGDRTIQINGAKFDRSVTVELVDAQGVTSPAVRYYRVSDTRLYATFDLRSMVRGNYSVRLTKASTNETTNVANALQVVFATASTQPISLTRPDSFNRRRDERPPAIIPVSLGWRNTTLNDIAVPLIHFSATDPFGTTLENAKANVTINTTEFLGMTNTDGPRDILLPGDAATAEFYIKPRAVDAVSPPIDIHYVAEYFYNPLLSDYPWDFDFSQLDFSYLSDDQAIEAMAAFREQFGSTAGAYRRALTEALQRLGDATTDVTLDDFPSVSRYLLQDVFDRFVAARGTSLTGSVSSLSFAVDYQALVVTLKEINGSRTFSTRVAHDGSFVFPSLPVADLAVSVTGGPVKAADALTVRLTNGVAAHLAIPLIATQSTEADPVPATTPLGTSTIVAPMLTRAGKINEAMTGNVLDSISSQLVGINYRVELVGDAPLGFTLFSDGQYKFSSPENIAFVVHYDLVLPDNQTRAGRLLESEIRSRGALAITLKNNFTRDLRSLDPNDILGPQGYGDQKWVSASERLKYTIRFENDPNQASSPAQVVRIVQTLDSDLDPATVEFSDFYFGGRLFTVQGKFQSLNYDIDLRSELGIYVRVFAFVDAATGEVSWSFSSISPDNGR